MIDVREFNDRDGLKSYAQAAVKVAVAEVCVKTSEPQVPPLRSPRFPVKRGALASFLRLSLRKGAYVAVGSAAR